MNKKKIVNIWRDDFLVSILPAAGGKIASIRMRGSEMLQAPLTGSMERSRTMAFDACDASGWDECLPSVAPCAVSAAAGTVEIPDHGDLWRVPWQILEASKSSCAMRARCFSLPLELQRTIALNPIGGGYRMHIEFSVSNVGVSEVPWAWSAHPLFAVEAGDRILLPASISSVRVEGSTGERIGKPGAVVNWPIAETAHGSRSDLSVVQAPQSGIGDKLFAGPLAEDEDWCALERSSAGIRIQVGFNPSATPFLGLWLCYGGWPARPGPKQMCVALEPSTAPVDSLAHAGSWQRRLASGASFQWSMTADFQRLS